MNTARYYPASDNAEMLAVIIKGMNYTGGINDPDGDLFQFVNPLTGCLYEIETDGHFEDYPGDDIVAEHAVGIWIKE